MRVVIPPRSTDGAHSALLRQLDGPQVLRPGAAPDGHAVQQQRVDQGGVDQPQGSRIEFVSHQVYYTADFRDFLGYLLSMEIPFQAIIHQQSQKFGAMNPWYRMVSNSQVVLNIIKGSIGDEHMTELEYVDGEPVAYDPIVDSAESVVDSCIEKRHTFVASQTVRVISVQAKLEEFSAQYKIIDINREKCGS